MTKCHLPRAEDPRLWVVDHLSTDVSRAVAALCQAGSQLQSQHRRLNTGRVVQDIRVEALYPPGAVFYKSSTHAASHGAVSGCHLNNNSLNDIQFDFFFLLLPFSFHQES